MYVARLIEMRADPYTPRAAVDSGATVSVEFTPSITAPADALMMVSPIISSSEEEIQMNNPEGPADPTFDASSGDETEAGMPELIPVQEAEVVHQPSMVSVAERIRVVYRGSVAQSSYEAPLPNTYLWSSMHGLLADHTMSPVRTALSSTDAELFALAHLMR